MGGAARNFIMPVASLPVFLFQIRRNLTLEADRKDRILFLLTYMVKSLRMEGTRIRKTYLLESNQLNGTPHHCPVSLEASLNNQKFAVYAQVECGCIGSPIDPELLRLLSICQEQEKL